MADDGWVSRYSLAGLRSMSLQPLEQLLAHARAVLAADDRITAAWLVGSFAVGEADEFSDVDLACLVSDEDLKDLRGSWRSVLDRITPTVNVDEFPFAVGGACITPQWQHLDLVFHSAAHFDPKTVRGMVPLFDKVGVLPSVPVPRPDPRGAPFFPDQAVRWFFYMLGNSVVVVGRNDVIPGTNGVIITRDTALIPLLLAERGLRSVGDKTGLFPFTKRLRVALSDEQNDLLESLPPLAPTIDSVIDGYRALARAFIPRARGLAAKTGATWPEAFEAATVGHFESSFGVTIAD